MTLFAWVILPFASSAQELALGDRYSPGVFHPNLLAFTLAPSVVLSLIWTCFSKGTFDRLVFAATACVSSYQLFATGSRGSLVAVAAAAFAGLLILVFARRKNGAPAGKGKLLYIGIISLGVLVLIFKVLLGGAGHDFVYEFLQLDSKYRGLDSGMSGRVDVWGPLWEQIKGNYLFWGAGYRASDHILVDSIDNGMLVASFDFGLLPCIFLTGCYLLTAYLALKTYRSAAGEERHYYLCYVLLVICFLVNNIVTRYLFGLGNVFSLFAIFFLTFPFLTTSKKSVFQTGGEP